MEYNQKIKITTNDGKIEGYLSGLDIDDLYYSENEDLDPEKEISMTEVKSIEAVEVPVNGTIYTRPNPQYQRYGYGKKADIVAFIDGKWFELSSNNANYNRSFNAGKLTPVK